jgi:hypothetical protein
MKKSNLFHAVLLPGILIFALSCQKEAGYEKQLQEETNTGSLRSATPPFNLEVILRGEGGQFGHVKFRQDVDASKIVTLETWVRDLEPNHEYLLQRAVDPANVVDGNCTSTSWLTLGKGLTPQSILTDDKGTGNESLWRDISAIPTGTGFDIHFRVIDKTTNAVVLNSDCYEYVVR